MARDLPNFCSLGQQQHGITSHPNGETADFVKILLSIGPNESMRWKPAVLFLVCLASALAGCRGLGTTAVGGGATDAPPPQGAGSSQGLNTLNHIVVMYQENHTFDSYFSQLNEYRQKQGLSPDADVASPAATNPSYDGTTQVQRFHLNTVCFENVSPSWNETHVQMSLQFRKTPGSKVLPPYPMDGFVFSAAKFAQNNSLNDTEGLRSMGYYDASQIPYYYFMATTFATSDRFFSAVPANSPPNRLFTFGGTSEGYTYRPDQPMTGKPIFQLLEEAGISWKIYVTDVTANGPVTYLTYYPLFFQAHKDKVQPLQHYFDDLNNGTLPQVAFVEGGYKSGLDEHPTANIQKGAAHVAKIINALMQSTSWKDSVFILGYDEGGGLYDHVSPPDAVAPDDFPVKLKEATNIEGDFTRYGLRMPILVVSPWAKRGYISHTVMDNTAPLKLIETRFGLPNLTQRDRSQPDMSEFFDFTQAPMLTPPAPPAQPTDGACYYNHLP